jgi:hypothetical protein
MGTKLQGAIIAVREECFAINAQEFFCLLDRDPSAIFGHGLSKGCVHIYATNFPRAVKGVLLFFIFVFKQEMCEVKLK